MHQAQTHVVTGRYAVQVFLKQTFELAPGQTDVAGDFIQAYEFLNIGFHVGHGFRQLGLTCTELETQGKSLPIVTATNALHQEFFGNFRGQIPAMLLGNEIDHHVHGGTAAGTGIPVTINFKHVLADHQLGKALAQADHVFPVNGASVILEQAGIGEDERSGADRAEVYLGLGLITQPAGDGPCIFGFNVDTAAYEHRVQLAGISHRRGGNGELCAGVNGLVSLGQQHPLVQLFSAKPVGHAQLINGCSERHHRIFRHQQKPVTGEFAAGNFLGWFFRHYCNNGALSR